MTARLVFGQAEIPSSTLEESVRRTAGGLERLGVGERDVVCLMLHNSPAFLEAMLAARLIGAYYCPINWHYKAAEAGWMLRDSGARALVIERELRSQIDHDFPKKLEILDPEDASWHAPWSQTPRAPGGMMPYTSGTTGRAKGVRRLAPEPRQVEAMAALVASVLGIEPGMRALLSAPLYHSAPAGYALYSMLSGELLALEERFDAERTLALIQELKLTHAYLVPTMYVRLLRLSSDVKARYDVSSIRFVASTGSPCPAEVKRAMIDWWGPVFHESYAASELGYVTAISSAEALRKPGSAGRPAGQATIRILDAEGRELPRGEVGLIYARQPAYPDFAYNNDPESRRGLERDGLCSLGDMGFIDDDGYLYVCDRASDMVISGGVNIYPAEIEAALALMPGVRDCAVFGVPDAEFGEALAAAVQLEPEVTLTPSAMRDFLSSKIAAYKIPKIVTFHDTLPREDSGKIFKRRLRAPYWEKSGRKI
ncbi:MAG TPA: AMP-binding protein [Burkholderiales bacterium]|nr:AMP-binding protein [Burkholderiales bacterium]